MDSASSEAVGLEASEADLERMAAAAVEVAVNADGGAPPAEDFSSSSPAAADPAEMTATPLPENKDVDD